MPAFCLPCWLSNAPSKLDDRELVSLPVKTTDLAPDDRGLGKPSSGELADEAAQEFLKALLAMAKHIPVPGVGVAVEIASRLIQACDESHATLERAQELKYRIKTLVTVLVTELKEVKKHDEIQDKKDEIQEKKDNRQEEKVGGIQEKLEQDIKSLNESLEYIKLKLDEIASQHAFLVIFFRNLNEDKVRKCIMRLDNALESFHLMRQINDANALDRMEQQILTFHAESQKSVAQLQETVEEMMDEMRTNFKAVLEDRRPNTSSSSGPRSVMPANTSILHGRDSLVADLVRILTAPSEGQQRPRVCLLGPGGMGKTSTALAVMADRDMKKHFPDENQFWVPCVKATTVSLFLDTLYKSLGMTQNTGNGTLHDIISQLKSFSEPLILLLDNFETPWNVDDGPSETEQILYKITQIAHVAVFITMRSSIPPCNGIQWQQFDLEAVDEDAARRIYSGIYTEGGDDPKLPDLLQVVGHMPLAVTLMAAVGKINELGAEELIREYKRTGTAMLEQGSNPDSKHSLDVCLSLSVELNPSMKNHPEALDLLAILAMLPVGTTRDALESRWARGLPNLNRALGVLREAALVGGRKSNFFVLPVIRSYILSPSRFPKKVHVAMIESACNFLAQHKSSLGEPSFKDHALALSAEESNLQAILLDTKVAEPSVIEALLVLARYQMATRARVEVIGHALNLTRQTENFNLSHELLGDILECYGWILRYLDQYDDAVEKFNLAREEFLLGSNEKCAAECWLNIVEVYAFMPEFFDQSLISATQAKSIFEKLDDPRGVARSLYHLGTAHRQCGMHMKAIESLTRGMEMSQALAYPLNHADCSYLLSWFYVYERRYKDAQMLATSAVEEYERMGQYTGNATQIIGRTLFFQGDYAAALKKLVQCLEVTKSYGRPLGIAQTLEMIGRTWAKMDQTTDARSAYTQAMKYFASMQTTTGRDGVTRCEIFSRMLDDPTLVPDRRERQALAFMHVDFKDF